MYIELESVFNSEDENIPFEYSFTLNESMISTPVSVKGNVFNKTGIVHLKAALKFDVLTECALCCKPLLRHAAVPVHHVLILHSENEAEDDDLYLTVEHTRFDLNELFSEEIYLAMPARFLCKPDCKGLCGICGADLNETVCNCKKPTDPRWDALKDLF